jgi:hypothetical protein
MKYSIALTTVIDQANVDSLKMLLEKEDMPCLIRNEHLSMSEVPLQESVPELWVLNDVDFARAFELVEAWRSAPVESQSQWVCLECGETLEGQFTSCWKCGSQREEAYTLRTRRRVTFIRSCVGEAAEAQRSADNSM